MAEVAPDVEIDAPVAPVGGLEEPSSPPVPVRDLEKGEDLYVFHGPSLYAARIVDCRLKEGKKQYLIHYFGWKKVYDEWLDLDSSRILPADSERLKTHSKSIVPIRHAPGASKTLKHLTRFLHDAPGQEVEETQEEHLGAQKAEQDKPRSPKIASSSSSTHSNKENKASSHRKRHKSDKKKSHAQEDKPSLPEKVETEKTEDDKVPKEKPRSHKHKDKSHKEKRHKDKKRHSSSASHQGKHRERSLSTAVLDVAKVKRIWEDLLTRRKEPSQDPTSTEVTAAQGQSPGPGAVKKEGGSSPSKEVLVAKKKDKAKVKKEPSVVVNFDWAIKPLAKPSADGDERNATLSSSAEGKKVGSVKEKKQKKSTSGEKMESTPESSDVLVKKKREDKQKDGTKGKDQKSRKEVKPKILDSADTKSQSEGDAVREKPTGLERCLKRLESTEDSRKGETGGRGKKRKADEISEAGFTPATEPHPLSAAEEQKKTIQLKQKVAVHVEKMKAQTVELGGEKSTNEQKQTISEMEREKRRKHSRSKEEKKRRKEEKLRKKQEQEAVSAEPDVSSKNIKATTLVSNAGKEHGCQGSSARPSEKETKREPSTLQSSVKPDGGKAQASMTDAASVESVAGQQPLVTKKIPKSSGGNSMPPSSVQVTSNVKTRTDAVLQKTVSSSALQKKESLKSHPECTVEPRKRVEDDPLVEEILRKAYMTYDHGCSETKTRTREELRAEKELVVEPEKTLRTDTTTESASVESVAVQQPLVTKKIPKSSGGNSMPSSSVQVTSKDETRTDAVQQKSASSSVLQKKESLISHRDPTVKPRKRVEEDPLVEEILRKAYMTYDHGSSETKTRTRQELKEVKREPHGVHSEKKPPSTHPGPSEAKRRRIDTSEDPLIRPERAESTGMGSSVLKNPAVAQLGPVVKTEDITLSQPVRTEPHVSSPAIMASPLGRTSSQVAGCPSPATPDSPLRAPVPPLVHRSVVFPEEYKKEEPAEVKREVGNEEETEVEENVEKPDEETDEAKENVDEETGGDYDSEEDFTEGMEVIDEVGEEIELGDEEEPAGPPPAKARGKQRRFVKVQLDIPPEFADLLLRDDERCSSSDAVKVEPAEVTVNQILDGYLSTKTDLIPLKSRVVHGVVAQVKVLFEMSLPTRLLYVTERASHREVTERLKKPPGDIYGGLYLLRLLCSEYSKLVTHCMNHRDMDERKTALMMHYIYDIVSYMRHEVRDWYEGPQEDLDEIYKRIAEFEPEEDSDEDEYDSDEDDDDEEGLNGDDYDDSDDSGDDESDEDGGEELTEEEGGKDRSPALHPRCRVLNGTHRKESSSDVKAEET